jgi:hypothetical protein
MFNQTYFPRIGLTTAAHAQSSPLKEQGSRSREGFVLKAQGLHSLLRLLRRGRTPLRGLRVEQRTPGRAMDAQGRTTDAQGRSQGQAVARAMDAQGRAMDAGQLRAHGQAPELLPGERTTTPFATAAQRGKFTLGPSYFSYH